MANYRMVLDQRWDAEAGSLRSRASSVISTGTKFSFSTLAHEEPQPNIDGVLGRLNSVASRDRPRSILSCEEPAPPYEDREVAGLAGAPGNTEDESLARTRSSTPVAEENAVASTPPSDADNAISTHYTHILRSLDTSHARELSLLKDSHTQELCILRASLSDVEARIEALRKEHEHRLAATRNEIDQIYRKEFKAVRREAEKTKEKAEEKAATAVQGMKDHAAAEFGKLKEEQEREIVRKLREEHERDVVRARNAVEDVWEARWRDRIRVAAEEVERVETTSRERLGRAAERVMELATRYPEISQELASVVMELEAT